MHIKRPALVFSLAVVFQRFGGLLLRNREPRATITVFFTGKMICTGTDRFVWIYISSNYTAVRCFSDPLLPVRLISIVKARLVVRKFARKLQKIGFPVRLLNFKINNLVAACKTFPVNLEKLYKICGQSCRSGNNDSHLLVVPIMCQPVLLSAKRSEMACFQGLVES